MIMPTACPQLCLHITSVAYVCQDAVWLTHATAMAYCYYCYIRYIEGLRAGRLGFYSRQRQHFSLLHSVQTGSGAHRASYPVGTGGEGCFARGKADHSPPSSAKVKNVGGIPSLPRTSSWHGS
jgi:hypothetical protein